MHKTIQSGTTTENHTHENAGRQRQQRPYQQGMNHFLNLLNKVIASTVILPISMFLRIFKGCVTKHSVGSAVSQRHVCVVTRRRSRIVE